MKRRCPTCDFEWPSEARFCAYDGAKLEDIAESEDVTVSEEKPKTRKRRRFSETAWFMMGDQAGELPEAKEPGADERYHVAEDLPEDVRRKYSLDASASRTDESSSEEPDGDG